MRDDDMTPLSPLAANLRRCYAGRPDQIRSNLPVAGNDLFGLYLSRLAHAGAEGHAATPALGLRPFTPQEMTGHFSAERRKA